MAEPIEIAPSILSAGHARLEEQVAEALAAGSQRTHVDIMDGHFVPNLTFGPGTVAALVPQVHDTGGIVECHLMVEDPDRYLADFTRAGADLLTVHVVEACPQLHRTVHAARAGGADVGVALNPATPLTAAEEILNDVDVLLVMTVDPALGAQPLIPATLGKVRRAAGLLADRELRGAAIEVDGGIHENTIARAVAAGATITVAGSAVFDAARPVSSCLAALRAAARPGTTAPTASESAQLSGGAH